MSTLRKTVALGAALAVTVALSACATGTTTEPDATNGAGESGPKIAAFVLATANSYSQSNMEGVQKAVDEAGGSVQFFDGQFSGSEQLAQIQDALATGGFDGFVIFPNDGAAIVPGVEEAAAEGIPTVAAYAPIGTDTDPEPQVEGVIGTVWHPNSENGTELGRLAVEACETEHADASPCKVAYISGGNAVLFEQLKLQAFQEELDSASSSIELVSQQEGNFLIADSRTAAENILQANPDIDVIVTSGDQMTIGAQQAVADAGAEGVSLIGNGAATEGVEAIAAGDWFASPVFLAIDEGYLATKMLIDSLAGIEPAETVIDVVKHAGIDYSITRENFEGFVAQWSAGA